MIRRPDRELYRIVFYAGVDSYLIDLEVAMFCFSYSLVLLGMAYFAGELRICLGKPDVVVI